MSDYETAQRRRDIIVGIFVVAAVCSLVWLIFKFGEFPTVVSKISSFRVLVQFSTVSGVQKDTPVNFCGYQIGRVTHIMAPQMLKDLSTGLVYHQTKVVLSINKKYANIPSNVVVKLMRRGLGSSFIELAVDPTSLPAPPRDPNRPETAFLIEGMLLQGSTGVTSEFFPEESQKKLDELVGGLSQLIKNANDVLGDPNNKENLKITLAHLSEATKQADHTLKEFQELAAATTITLKNADAKTTKLVTAMVDTSQELSKVISQLRVILGKIDHGQGTAAKILNDGRLYENMLENTQQLQKMVKEIEAFAAEARKKGLKIKLK